MIQEDLNLTKADYIYAADNFPKAWEIVAHIQNNNPCIIIIYRKKYFYNVAKRLHSGDYIWARKDKSIDFRDTIGTIIRVRFF